MTSQSKMLARTAQDQVLILDGAMGTVLGPGSDPRAEARVHRAYLGAGADIITTNSFLLNAIDLALPVGSVRVERLNYLAARRARKLADQMSRKMPAQPRFVAGSVGPTRANVGPPTVHSSTGPGSSYDDLVLAYSVQMRGLIRGGVDAILMETACAESNLKAALVAFRRSTRTRTQQPLLWVSAVPPKQRSIKPALFARRFWRLVGPYRPWCVGFNCAPPQKRLRDFIAALGEVASCRLSVHPSAGMPDCTGEYPISPDQFARGLKPLFASRLVSIVGGCCGTTPEYVAGLRKLP